jgi:NTP pyrophosphatase (non-canonical NTP hydrolase)
MLITNVRNITRKRETNMTINEVAIMVHDNARAHGFHPEEKIEIFFANQCNNLHNEVSELWDCLRSGIFYNFCDKADKMRELNIKPLTSVEEELADIIIRALDISMRLNINVEEAVLNKHQYNLQRPYKHGKMN